MSFVLDASIALAWLLQDEGDESTDALVERLTTESACAPSIWPLEVMNALSMAARRGRITPNQIEPLAQVLTAYPIEVTPASLEAAFAPVGLATQHGLTVYDAAYLELAQRRQLPLATLDQRLREACSELNIAVLPDHV